MTNPIYNLQCSNCNQKISKQNYISELIENIYALSNHLSNVELLSITTNDKYNRLLPILNSINDMILNSTNDQEELIYSSVDYLYLILDYAVKHQDNQRLSELKNLLSAFWMNKL
jgi:hypothetical protein